jgi:hypothetical protein
VRRVNGANARTRGGGALAHWAFLPAPRIGGLGALRVRIYWPVPSGADTVVRTAQADGNALVREVCQGSRRCVEEHWWPAGAAPAGLIPEEPEEPGEQARSRIARRPLRLGTPMAPQAGILLATLDIALRDETRPVISVAACFDSVPADPLACRVRIRAATEGRIRLDVETDSGTRVLRAAVWFGCGARPRPPLEVHARAQALAGRPAPPGWPPSTPARPRS